MWGRRRSEEHRFVGSQRGTLNGENHVWCYDTLGCIGWASGLSIDVMTVLNDCFIRMTIFIKKERKSVELLGTQGR